MQVSAPEFGQAAGRHPPGFGDGDLSWILKGWRRYEDPAPRLWRPGTCAGPEAEGLPDAGGAGVGPRERCPGRAGRLRSLGPGRCPRRGRLVRREPPGPGDRRAGAAPGGGRGGCGAGPGHSGLRARCRDGAAGRQQGRGQGLHGTARHPLRRQLDRDRSGRGRSPHPRLAARLPHRAEG